MAHVFLVSVNDGWGEGIETSRQEAEERGMDRKESGQGIFPETSPSLVTYFLCFLLFTIS